MTRSEHLVKIWSHRIEEWQTSGMSITKWCKEQNLPEHQFHYWRKRIDPNSRKQTSNGFRELKEAKVESSGVLVQYCGIEIKLATNFDHSTFLECLSLLRSCG